MNRESKERLIELLSAKKTANRDRFIQCFNPSLIQKEFLLSNKKIRLLCGANRAGKTLAGAIDILTRATGLRPEILGDNFPEARFGEYWVTSLDFPSSRDITQKKILSSIPQYIYNGFNKEFRVLSIKVKDKLSEVGFKSADSGRTKFQGTSKLGIWNDEEVPEDVWDEEYMRTTDCSGFMTLTFTPIEGLTWAYSKLYKKAHKYTSTKNKHSIPEDVGIVHTLDEIKKLKDRELVIIPNTDPGANVDVECFQMGIYDNPVLPDLEIQRAEEKYKDDLLQYNARILGRFTKLSGRNVFDIKSLMDLQSNLPSSFTRGKLEKNEFHQELNGNLILYMDLKEVKKRHFVIGADVAEGLETGDFSVAQILDHKTGEQVAKWKGHCSPEEFANILVQLGKFFNNAYLAPERNLHGFGVISIIRDKFRYQRLFFEYDIPNKVLRGSATLGPKKYGWETNVKTKAIMIQDLSLFIRQKQIKINDMSTLDELITFVYDREGKTGAMGGCFDDEVMALAIAVQVFQRRRPVLNPKLDHKNEIIDEYTGY